MKFLLDGEESERLMFRNVSEDDFNDWLEFHKDPASTQHWKGDFQDPETECKKWYKKQEYRLSNNLGGMNALIEKSTGKFIGHCGLLVQTVDDITELEIGYSLLRKYRGFGYATEAAKKCRDYAFENEFSEMLISIISLTNIPSSKVALKNGMTVDKTTIFENNDVNIYRVVRENWLAMVR